ncbi:hypothetical protein TNIN_93231 [Trichonephila inaurata madagascariensis]|uniref:Uncharacterized protein n=1 Tax=Trichonephila inaurata madagascariensis TaxID=2747483 RepID=A0A8X6X8F0_9ARAC|nr:hypothetical protein TNIN_93231 [Trichonephila inaurata madagascariensis]
MTECVSLLLPLKRSEERERVLAVPSTPVIPPFLLNDHPSTGVFALPVGNEKLFPLPLVCSFKCGKVPETKGNEVEEPEAEG